MCQDCIRLHEKLQNQSERMYLLRKENAKLQKRLRLEVHQKMKLVKDKKHDQKIRYKNRKKGEAKFYGYM